MMMMLVKVKGLIIHASTTAAAAAILGFNHLGFLVSAAIRRQCSMVFSKLDVVTTATTALLLLLFGHTPFASRNTLLTAQTQLCKDGPRFLHFLLCLAHLVRQLSCGDDGTWFPFIITG